MKRLHVRSHVVIALVLAVPIAVGVGAWWLNYNAARVFGADGDAFGSSLARATDEVHAARCSNQPQHDWWICGVERDLGSGYSGQLYRLVAEESGCWMARKLHLRPNRRHTRVVGTSLRGPNQSGCIRLLDYVWPKTVDEAPPDPVSRDILPPDP